MWSLVSLRKMAKAPGSSLQNTTKKHLRYSTWEEERTLLKLSRKPSSHLMPIGTNHILKRIKRDSLLRNNWISIEFNTKTSFVRASLSKAEISIESWVNLKRELSSATSLNTRSWKEKQPNYSLNLRASKSKLKPRSRKPQPLTLKKSLRGVRTLTLKCLPTKPTCQWVPPPEFSWSPPGPLWRLSWLTKSWIND